MMRHNSSTSSWTQTLQNKIVALVLAMIVVVPFVATPADGGLNLGAISFEAFGVLLLIVLLWRARWNTSRENVLTFLRTGANLPVLLFWGLALLSCLISPHKEYSVQETLRLSAGVMLYFMVAYHFRRAEQLTKLVDVLLIVSILASLIGFIQYGMGKEEQQFATGFLGDHQLYGSFMMILAPIVAVIAITERAPNRQLMAQIGTVMTIVALLLSYSRSAWIGGGAGMIALALLAIYTAAKKRMSTRRYELIVPIMLLVVSVGFFMLLSPSGSAIITRAGTLSQVQVDRGWQYRQNAWQGAVQMIKERPLLGFGIGLYPYYQQQYTHSGMPLWQFRPHGDSFPKPSLGEQAHNSYLQTAAELGIPGLILFVAIIASFLGFALQKVGSMDVGIRRNLLIGAMGSIVAFAIDAFGSPSWQLAQVSMFFWLILGIGVGSLRPRSKHIHAEETPALSPPLRLTRSSGLLACIGLAVLIPLTANAVCPPSYLIPVSADIEPKNLTVTQNAGQQRQVDFSLTVTFRDPNTNQTSTFDVTLCPGTNFTQIGGDGTLIGTNNHTYLTAPNEFDTLQIRGDFTQNAVNVNDTTNLTVHTNP